MQTTPTRIKDILKERKMTYAQLAELMQTSKQNVTQQLNKESLTTAFLDKVASALDVPMWHLFVSPSDISPTSPTESIVFACPNCGKRFKIVEVEE